MVCRDVAALIVLGTLGCGARSGLLAAERERGQVEGGGGGTVAVGVGGGGMGGSGGDAPTGPGCSTPVSWGARLGDAEDLESTDAITVDARCVAYIAGDVSAGLFLQGYAEGGTLLVDERFEGSDGQLMRALDVDAAGNIVVAAQVWGSIDLGGGILSSVENWDMVLASFTAEGEHRWSLAPGGPDYQEATDVTVDGDGNVVLAGQAAGAVDFGGGALTPTGSLDIALASYTADGAHRWSQLYGDAEIQSGPRVAGGSGGFYVAGYFHGTVDMGQALSAVDQDDSYLVHLDVDGNFLSALHLGGAGTQRALDVEAREGGGAVVVGYFTDELTVGTLTFVSEGPRSAFAVMTDANGAIIQAESFGAPGAEVTFTSVTRGLEEAMYVAGEMQGDGVTFGNLTVSARRAHVVIRFLDSGARGAAVREGEAISLSTRIHGVPSGGYVLGGALSGSAMFGFDDLVSAGGTDAFIGRYAPP